MRELISRIVEYSFSESKNIRKGLGEIMGGQVLELESDRLIKKGEQLGEARGKENWKRAWSRTDGFSDKEIIKRESPG